MQTEVISVEAAASALLGAEQTWANALANEEIARHHEREIAALSQALCTRVVQKEQAVTAAEVAAMYAAIHDRVDADEQRKALLDLRSEVSFLRRVVDRFNLFEVEDVRMATLEAQGNSAEARWRFEVARSEDHNARLCDLISDASLLNQGIEFSDSGVSTALRQLSADAGRASRDAREVVVSHRKRVEQARADYTRTETSK
jgi:hypothetical protein